MSFIIKRLKGKGRGVIADKNFRKGTLVLTQEILIIPDPEQIGEFLDHYVYDWDGLHFLCLGIGSLLNHSNDPNLIHGYRKKEQQLLFYAEKPIRKGDELTIDYEWPSYPWEEKA